MSKMDVMIEKMEEARYDRRVRALNEELYCGLCTRSRDEGLLALKAALGLASPQKQLALQA